MNENKFFHNENDGFPGGQGGAAPDPSFRENNGYLQQAQCNDPRRLDSESFYSGGQNGGKKPKKEKSPFLTKKAAAVVLTLCVAASAVFGFGVGTMNGRNSAATATTQNSTGVLQASADVSNLSGGDLSVSDIAAKTQDSVVEITTEVVQTNQFMQQVSGEAAGSGVIISEDGYIVTNNHVVEDGTSFTVRTKDGTSYEAALVGRDPQTDLAVLKIEATGLTPVTFGDSDALAVGDTTVAIGNPLGTLGGTVTDGIVSATNREINLGNGTMNLIQTNAAINPGNSGGGLFNGQGELIGIVVAKSGGTNVEGLGYAIPVNEAKTVIDELIENGYVTGRISIGISVLDISDVQTAMNYGLSGTGVYVAQVTEGSTAEKLGIQAGDRIVSLDGKEIASSSDLEGVIDSHSVGDTVEITIERSGRTASTNITLEEYVPSNS
ncbi:S1C family serine protease [Christensenella tenuis]|jgi:serine protease Do|uniref:Trypsin-like peptidase domain-containing protein n=1 Tax=Christensenella tenuis TaxID=2763033 RepID=A0ABR7EE72_9FIRM|nr:trypsin-like peptidase domain-containing protein [Christensenella tenuis]MBC5647646.1 trypsin-like peptidase domain-containing protein [Christensenella tenuis]